MLQKQKEKVSREEQHVLNKTTEESNPDHTNMTDRRTPPVRLVVCVFHVTHMVKYECDLILHLLLPNFQISTRLIG